MECEIRRVAPDEWAAFRDVRLAALAEAPYAFAATLDVEAGYGAWRWRERVSTSVETEPSSQRASAPRSVWPITM